MSNAAITVDLNARIAQFETEMKRATGTLDSFGRKGDQIAAGLKGAFAGMAAGLSVGALAAFAKSGIDAADALNDMSLRLKVSVKDLASFKLIAEQSGTSLEGVGKGIARLTRSMGDAEGGNKQLAAALSTLGVTARDPKEAFYQLADAVQKIQDPAKRAALLNQVLGKSYQELIPLLEIGGQSLRDSAKASETFSDAMARLAPNADRFNDELATLKINAAGAAGSLLTRLVPSLADTAQRVRELLDDNKGISALVRAIAGLGKLPFDAIFGDIKSAATSQDRIKELRSELSGLQSDLKKSQAGGSHSSVVMRSMFGTPEELTQKVNVIKSQILALEKFGDKIYKQKPKGPDAVIPGLNLPETKAKGGAKTDPLASLLGSTDIGKLEEFEKKVGLLNARFDGGRKSTELYTQAMTKLIETAFSTNFSEYDKQLKDSIAASKEYASVQAEFERAGEMAAKAAENDAAAIAAQVLAQREHNEEIGLSAVALNELEQARFDASIAALQQFEAERLIAGASNEELAAIWDKIDALKQLKQLRGEGATKQGNFDALKDLNDYLDPAKAKTFGDVLSNSFGKAGTAIGKMAGAFDNYAQAQAEFSKKRAALSPEDLIKKETELTRKQADIQIDAYANMAGAAKTFFDEGSTGYKVLSAAEQGFRAIQMALSIAAMIRGTTETTASVAQSGTKAVASTAAGVAKAFEQMGVWGFIGAAAIIAFMASMGVKGGGGSAPSMSAQRQATQGTGTVLGDDSAQSESLTNALELLADVNTLTMQYSARMAKSLQNIEVALTGVSSMIYRTPGLTSGNLSGISEMGKKSTSPLMPGFSSRSVSVTDSGLTYKGLVSGIEEGLKSFTDITTNKSSFFGLKKSSKTSTVTGDASDDIAQQFGMIFDSLADSLVAAGSVLGNSADILETQIAGMEIDLGMVSLKGLKGDELEEALNAVISAAADTIAMQALPGLDKYQQVGEGYYETAIRVAYSTEAVQATLGMLDNALTGTNTEIVDFSQELINLFGDLETMGDAVSSYYDAFYSEEEKLANTTTALAAGFANLGMAMPATKDEFRGMVDALDMTSVAGREAFVSLMGMSPAFAEVADAATEAAADLASAAAAIADERIGLENQLLQAQGNTVELRRRELMLLDESNRALQETIWSLSDASDAAANSRAAAAAAAQATATDAAELAAESTAATTAAMAALSRAVAAEREAITAAYDTERDTVTAAYEQQSEAIKASIDSVSDSVSSLKALSSALESSLDGMRPEEFEAQYRALAQAQLKAALNAARGGAMPSADSLKATLSDLGKDSTGQFATRTDYLRDQLRTAADMRELSSITDNALSIDELNLTALQDQSDLLKLNHDAMLESMKLSYDGEMQRLDGILDGAQAQLDALNGIDTSVISVADAVKALTAAMAIQAAATAASTKASAAAESFNPTFTSAAGATYNKPTDTWTSANGLQQASTAGLKGAIQAIYEQDGARALYEAARGVGLSLSDVNAVAGAPAGTAEEWAKANGLPLFAAGTNYVPDDMIAGIHKGERIFPAADNEELMSRLRSPHSVALVNEIRALREEVVMLRGEARNTSNNTGKTAKLLDRAMPDGDALATRVAV